jgi:hypothetical protein
VLELAEVALQTTPQHDHPTIHRDQVWVGEACVLIVLAYMPEEVACRWTSEGLGALFSLAVCCDSEDLHHREKDWTLSN